MNILKGLRNQIDLIDSDIVTLVDKRMQVVKEVGRYKSVNNIAPLDAKRWDEVVKSRVSQGKKVGLSERLITEIFESIHREALEVESKIQNEK